MSFYPGEGYSNQYTLCHSFKSHLEKNGNNSMYIIDSKFIDRLNLVQLKPDNNISSVF